MSETEFTPGWGFPAGSRKAHWFDADGMAACRRWGFYGGRTEPGDKPGPDDCAACWKVLKRRAARNVAPAAVPGPGQGGEGS